MSWQLRQWLIVAALCLIFFGAIGGAQQLFAQQSGGPVVTEIPYSGTVTATLPVITETVTVTQPAPPPPAPSRVYGIANGAEITGGRSAADRAKELDGIKALGANAVRFDVPWSTVEPSRGFFNWSRIDDAVADAHARGLQVLLTIDYAPAWANGGFSNNKYAPLGPDMRQEFANFAARVATRYYPQGVRWYEVWNEPNHPEFWRPSPNAANYTDLLRKTSVAIKTLYPNAVVLGGALALPPGCSGVTCPNTFLTRMYLNGAKGYFDALSVHPYISNNEGIYWEWWKGPDGSGSWFGPAPSVKATLHSNEPNKMVWFTETGDTNIATTSTQAVTKVMNQLNTYRQQGWGGPPFWYAYRSIDSYSLTDSTFNPRPAWYTLRDWIIANP